MPEGLSETQHCFSQSGGCVGFRCICLQETRRGEVLFWYHQEGTEFYRSTQPTGVPEG